MTYSRHYPHKREPFFGNIFAYYMTAKSDISSKQEKTLCGTMAYRMCVKAAEDVPSHEVKVRKVSTSHTAQDPGTETEKELSNGRVLRTPDDLTLLLDVYESQGKYDEALAVLKSERTGIDSAIGKRSWSLVLRMIKLWGTAERYLEQFKFCFELLHDASPHSQRPQTHGFGKVGNDWAVWSAMYKAAKSLSSCKVKVIDW